MEPNSLHSDKHMEPNSLHSDKIMEPNSLHNIVIEIMEPMNQFWLINRLQIGIGSSTPRER